MEDGLERFPWLYTKGHWKVKHDTMGGVMTGLDSRCISIEAFVPFSGGKKELDDVIY